MNFIGSEVDVAMVETAGSSFDMSNPEESPEKASRPAACDDHDNTSVTEFDAHPPVTPPSSAEALFLCGVLPTQTISAMALAQEIHARHRPLSIATSIVTDDFATATAAEEIGNDDDSSSNDDMNNSDSLSAGVDDDADISALHLSTDNEENPFGKDALHHSREPFYDDDNNDEDEIFQDSRMTSTPSSTPSTNGGLHIDPAEKIYGAAKGTWAWGKGIIVFSPFMGLAEGIAGKLVETVGSSLSEVDSAVTGQLHGLDNGILNPAINAVVGTVLDAAGKTEDIIKPIVIAVLKPIGLIKDTPENTTSATSSSSGSIATGTLTKKKAGSKASAPEVTSPSRVSVRG